MMLWWCFFYVLPLSPNTTWSELIIIKKKTDSCVSKRKDRVKYKANEPKLRLAGLCWKMNLSQKYGHIQNAHVPIFNDRFHSLFVWFICARPPLLSWHHTPHRFITSGPFNSHDYFLSSCPRCGLPTSDLMRGAGGCPSQIYVSDSVITVQSWHGHRL